MLELVWLWNYQRQNLNASEQSTSGRNVNKTDVTLADIMNPQDSRFVPLATEMALALKGSYISCQHGVSQMSVQ